MLRLLLIVLMFIGGCAGSTGGGMKIVRVYVAMKIALRNCLQAIFPNAVFPVKVDGSPIPNRLLEGVMAYFLIFTGLFCFGSIAITLTETCSLDTSFSASIACLGNIGPGLGKVGATGNYEWVSASGKWILSFLMLAGRLELYSILILFLPSTWRR
ncbi:MAG: TrkH family potassium uptake protein [Candidatus Aureabacteria bacterium]|nr:TrkH family potassium uptake protein [Candidatus Auribacterota bacterium]